MKLYVTIATCLAHEVIDDHMCSTSLFIQKCRCHSNWNKSITFFNCQLR